jgi:hypothetical protein
MFGGGSRFGESRFPFGDDKQEGSGSFLGYIAKWGQKYDRIVMAIPVGTWIGPCISACRYELTLRKIRSSPPGIPSAAKAAMILRYLRRD